MAHNKIQTVQAEAVGPSSTPDAFRKAVQALHSKPRAPLTLLQRKLGNAWLKHAIESPPDAQGWWQLNIRELEQTIGFDSNNRQYLKDAAEALMAIVFEWDVMALATKRIHWKASVMFPELELRSDVIRFQISSQMRERVLNPDMYAMIDMNVVRRFKRAPALAMWEFCIRFEKLGQTAEVAWPAFRDMILGESADGKTYQEYKYFKSKVLLPSIKEINTESEHEIGLVETKIGRRIDMVRFTVVRKVKTADAAAPLENSPELDLLSDLALIGFSRLDGRRLLERHSAEELAQALAFTRHRMADATATPLARPAAYFRKALAHGYAKNEAVATVEQAPPAVEVTPRVEAVHERSSPVARTLQESRGELMRQKITQVVAHLQQLSEAERQVLVDRYNAAQTVSGLRVTPGANKVVELTFQRWLANDLWGRSSPSVEEALNHEQQSFSASQPV
jgi:hypothetical protein